MRRRRVCRTSQFYAVPIRSYISNTKLTEMKHLMTLMTLVVAVTAGAQYCSYNPDTDGDNLIGVTDVLQVLSLFGSAGDGTGVWCEANDWIYSESFECNNPMTVVYGQTPKALVMYHYGSASEDFATYMFENASEFYGFDFGSTPQTAQDIELYLSWPGWTSRTDAFAIEVDVPQISNGNDAFGNGRTAYVFETVEIVLSGPTWVTVLVPQSLMGSETMQYSTVRYDINGSPSTCLAASTSSSISNLTGCYTGPDFAHGSYRMYTSYGGTALSWSQTEAGFLRGGNLSE